MPSENLTDSRFLLQIKYARHAVFYFARFITISTIFFCHCTSNVYLKAIGGNFFKVINSPLPIDYNRANDIEMI